MLIVALTYLNKRTYKSKHAKTPESIMFIFTANVVTREDLIFKKKCLNNYFKTR